MAELEAFGFTEAGYCALDASLKSQVRFRLERLADVRAIYAFVVNDSIRYIGICESEKTTLKDRMGRYQGLVGAGTNERIVGLIKNCLQAGQAVRIFAWIPKVRLRLDGMDVDQIKGFENPLIQRFEPEWNNKL
ncbi:hypothetical protein [Methylomarinovum tepidoasis]|uniref:hypothetical protein n=1 Tax=Methylomarinovum tepidoasis TaxID=2840183 RepID=UPI002572EEC4|nr:hypothetical protein [Methylomarinovum sp. IN45]